MNGFGLPVFLWGVKVKKGEDILDLLTPKAGDQNGEFTEFSEIIAQIMGGLNEKSKGTNLYILDDVNSEVDDIEKKNVNVLQGNLLPIGDVKYVKVENIIEDGKPEENRSKPKSETGKTELILSVNSEKVENKIESTVQKTSLMDKPVYVIPQSKVKDVIPPEIEKIKGERLAKGVYEENGDNKKRDIGFANKDLLPQEVQPKAIDSGDKKEFAHLKESFNKVNGNTHFKFDNEPINGKVEPREFIKKNVDGGGNVNDVKLQTKVYAKGDYVIESVNAEVEKPVKREDIREVYHTQRMEIGKGEVKQFEDVAEVRQTTDISEYETNNISKPKRVHLKADDVNIVLKIVKEKLSVSVRSENFVPDNISFLDKIRLAERLHTIGFDLEMLSVNGWQIISKSEKPLNYNKKGDRDRESIRHEIIGKKTSSVSDNPDFSLLL